MHYCASGPTRDRLFGDKAFMLDLFGAVPELTYKPIIRENYHPEWYRWLSPELKMDLDIIAAAKNAGCANASDLPLSLIANREFWIHIIGKAKMFWYDLPEEFRNDSSFVRVMDFFADREMVEDVFEQFPLLSQNRDIWLTMIMGQSCFPNDLYDVLPELIRNAPRSIRLNRDLMLHACNFSKIANSLKRSSLRPPATHYH